MAIQRPVSKKWSVTQARNWLRRLDGKQVEFMLSDDDSEAYSGGCLRVGAGSSYVMEPSGSRRNTLFAHSTTLFLNPKTSVLYQEQYDTDRQAYCASLYLSYGDDGAEVRVASEKPPKHRATSKNGVTRKKRR